MNTNLSLFDENHFRSSVIKRMFKHTATEMVRELFQNSQRAGATEVQMRLDDLSKEPLTFIYQDNGHGILHGIEGWRTLLALAASSYEDETVKEQDPMGLGLNALLACQSVQAVRISSNGYQIELDTSRWWDDPGYYRNWDRLLTQIVAAPGFRLEVLISSSDYAKEIYQCLPVRSEFKESVTRTLELFPAFGYNEYLAITLNGEAVFTGIPQPKEYSSLFATTYQGCRLVLGYGGQNIVRWYGQCIMSPPISGIAHLCYFLDVKEGTPLTPSAPVRDTIIKNEAFDLFKAFVVDAFLYWSAREDIRMDIKLFEAIEGLNSARFRQESAWFSYWELAAVDRYDYHDYEKRKKKVALYSRPPQLYNASITIWQPDCDDWDVVDAKDVYGFYNFTIEVNRTTEAAFFFRYADKANHSRLPDPPCLHWVLGEAHLDVNQALSTDLFYAPGAWGLSSEEDEQPKILHEFSEDAHLWLFESRVYTQFMNADWKAIGTDDPACWLTNHAEEAYSDSYYDEEGGEEDHFYESVQEMLRLIKGNVVVEDYKLSDLEEFISRVRGTSSSLVQLLSTEHVYVQPEGGRSAFVAVKITARTQDRQSKVWSEPFMVQAEIA